MKLLQQLFGGNGLSLFGRSRSKVSVTNTNNSSASTAGLAINETTNTASIACHSATCRQSVVAHDVADTVVDCLPDSNKQEVTWSPMRCWSPTANRICWGSPSAHRSASRRAGVIVSDLGRNGSAEDATLPRSRSMIRTNPWLPPSSPPPDRRHVALGQSPSPTSGSGSASCPSTPADRPTESARRWRLVETVCSGDETTPVASEGYCSVSSLCTMSDSAIVSTTACSDDMQMSVDSLASLFPTLMSSSSTSFHDDKISGAGVNCDSVVDSGIVVSSTSIVDADSVSSVYDGEVRRKAEFDVVSTRSTKSDRSSDCRTPTNQYKTTSAATLTQRLCAVQAALGRSNDYEFDDDVFPFGSEVRQRSATAEPTQHNQKRSDLVHKSLQPVMSASRNVEEISSSLAASVERLRRGRIAVDGAFGRALAEDRRRQREVTRLRRRMVEAQRDVLLGTLRDLRRELDGQCQRLQAAYDAVLTSGWPRLHADTSYVTSTSANPLCQSAM